MTYELYFDKNKGTTCSRPNWIDDKGKPVADALLRTKGIYPVKQIQAGQDELLHQVNWLPIAEWPLVRGVYHRTQVKTDRDMLAVQIETHGRIDKAAELARGALLTPGSGQALEYLRTEAEARAAGQATEAIDLDAFPMLKAEVFARRMVEPDLSIDAIVDDVIAAADLALQIGTAIKQVRRTAKVLVEMAEQPETCRKVLDWANEAFSEIPKTGTFPSFENN